MFLLSLALAADTQLVYDLTVAGQRVGTREVTVRFYPRASGERRVVESYTKVALVNTELEARSSGQSGPRGATFSTSAATNGATTQVQGVEQPGGDWRVFWADGTVVNEQSVAANPTVLTTLDLLDPGRTALLRQSGKAALLFAETGDVLSGSLGAGSQTTATVGGASVAVTRFPFSTAGGRGYFDVDADGWLVGSEVQWLGVTLAATLRAVPPPRSYGSVDTLDALGVPIGEGAP